MGVVPNCKLCHHRSYHGSIINSLDTKLKQTDVLTGGGARTKCQVPVRVPIPNQPGTSMMVPCGCEGDLAAPGTAPMPELPTNVIAPPPKCVLPGCQEFSMPQSSFCSNEHLNLMVGTFSVKDESGNQDQTTEQGETPRAPRHSAGPEDSSVETGIGGSLEGPEPAQGSPVRNQREEVQALEQTDSGLYLARPDLDAEFFDNLFNHKVDGDA